MAHENPFDNEDGRFYVLINEEEQYSLWPTFKKVPDGWKIVLEESSRSECLEYVDREWTDMRPKSLRDAIAAEEMEKAQAREAREKAQALEES